MPTAPPFHIFEVSTLILNYDIKYRLGRESETQEE